MENDQARSGFTLIELLVILSVIAAIAAIVLPVFAQARHKARLGTCASNLHQIGLALTQYETDWNALPPNHVIDLPSSDPNIIRSTTTVWTAIQPYLGPNVSLSCPESDPARNNGYLYRAGPEPWGDSTHPVPRTQPGTVLVYCVAHLTDYPQLNWSDHFVHDRPFEGQFMVVREDTSVSKINASQVKLWNYYEGGTWYPAGSHPPPRLPNQNVSKVIQFPGEPWPPPGY